VSSPAFQPSLGLRADEAAALEREIRHAHESLHVCLREMEQVLARPAFDAGALTSVRLKLAGLRLTRGPLITRVAEALSGSLSRDEEILLEQLRSSHQRLLQTATAHTGKWTLEAIGLNWVQYRDETRDLMRRWMIKAEREQRLVYPLVRRCARAA
jgi:hypothetical protein